jgi:ribosome modulation factor
LSDADTFERGQDEGAMLGCRIRRWSGVFMRAMAVGEHRAGQSGKAETACPHQRAASGEQWGMIGLHGVIFTHTRLLV